VLVAAAISFASPGFPESPAALCVRLGTDDTLRPIPGSLTPDVNRLFHARMSARVAVGTTVYRCEEGRVLVCSWGANLPCGKANTSRTVPGATDWCRQNPDAAFIPAFATGHDTIYEWRCHGSVAIPARQTSTVDSRGFIAMYWKPLK
jgi:hypothetical protein